MYKKLIILLAFIAALTLSGCSNDYDKGIVELDDFEIITIDVTKEDALTYHLEAPYSDNERNALEIVKAKIFDYEFYTVQYDDGTCDTVSEKMITMILDEDTEANLFTRCATSNGDTVIVTVFIIGEDLYFTDEALYTELEELLHY